MDGLYAIAGFLPEPYPSGLSHDPSLPHHDMEPQPPTPKEVDEIWVNLVNFLLTEDHRSPDGDDNWLLPDLSRWITSTAREIARTLKRVVYLGPLRELPARHYVHSGLSWSDVGKIGDKLPEILLEEPRLLEDINETLRIFQADHQLVVRRAEGPGMEGLFTVRLLDTHTGIEVSAMDVGFGVGQVLPVIAQCLMRKGRTLIIEQPEIHLHPRLQAELGDLFAKCVSKSYGNQVIVETHSEYIIYRLQKLIRQGKLKPEDVSVVYVLKDEEGSHCRLLRLDEEGDFIDEWPHGFFEEGYREMFGS
jgi:hypothetical protein